MLFSEISSLRSGLAEQLWTKWKLLFAVSRPTVRLQIAFGWTSQRRLGDSLGSWSFLGVCFQPPAPRPLWIKEPTVQRWKPSHIRMSQHVTSEPCPVSLFLEEASARSADSVSDAAILSKSFLAHLSKSCFAFWPALTCHPSAENKLWKICASPLMTSLS